MSTQYRTEFHHYMGWRRYFCYRTPGMALCCTVYPENYVQCLCIIWHLIYWYQSIFKYPLALLHWQCGLHVIVPVSVKLTLGIQIDKSRKQWIFALHVFRTICNAWDLWKFTWFCKQLCLLCLPQPWDVPGTALLSGFQSSQGALKFTEQDST